MYRWFLSILGIMTMLAILSGCAKPHTVRTETRPSFFEATVRSNDHIRKAVFAPQGEAANLFLQQAGVLFAEALIGTVRERATGLVLHRPQEPGYPDFMMGSAPLFANPDQTFTLTENARLHGIHYVLDARVIDVRATERRTGVRWFRKMRHFMTVAVRLDVYDTFTGAKILCQVEEKTIRIDANAHEAFHAGASYAIADLDPIFDEMADKLGRQAVRMMRTLPFKASVTGVNGERVELAAGRGAGLRTGDRWDVYGARRTIDGIGGGRFVVPGYRVGTLYITEVGELSAEARVDGAADIHVGDFAIPGK